MNWADQAGCRQNDQAIIVELENNPVMIDQFLIGWDWLLTGSEPFLHNKTVFYLSLPPCSVLTVPSQSSLLKLTQPFLPVTTWDLVLRLPQCHSATVPQCPARSKLFIYTPLLHCFPLLSILHPSPWLERQKEELVLFYNLKTAIDLIWLILPLWASQLPAKLIFAKDPKYVPN